MIGKTISHYKILEKLGGGGMGLVYKAKDTKLKRTVALKFLPPELTRDPKAKQRFIQEAQSASLLDHPNICTIHEIDETEDDQMFICMACYEGETLNEKIKRGSLKLEDAVNIIIQVAEGLAKAHSKGIVHRDIKPANIFITEDRQVKILDFGLAKLTGQKRITRFGTAVGTATYMSPEQARGEEVDHRTDIWSLGVLLYEMITGQLPFKGENWEAVLYSIFNKEPQQPLRNIYSDVPESLQQLVQKMLKKDTRERYKDMGTLITDLKSINLKSEFITSPRIMEDKPSSSIAILPFLDMSPEKDQEYFCDGIAEELINSLTRIKGVRVVAQTPSFSFKGKNIDIRDIGRKLNVKILLKGSVQKAGKRLRITAQLVNVTDGYYLWSEKFDRDMEDIFTIQDEISLAIVENLKVNLLGGEKAKLMKHYTEDLEAHNLYMWGRFFWNKRTEEGLNKAIEYFNQTIDKDPNYALAYAGLTDSYITLCDYNYVPPKDVYPKAKEAVLKALEIDSTLAEVHTSLAMITFRQWDCEGAEKEFKRAFELSPNYANAHHWYALFLMYMGRSEEAIEEIKQAQKLDPLSLIINRNVAWVFYFARRYDKAVEALKKTLELDPNFILTNAFLGKVYLHMSLYEDALREIQKEKDITGRFDPLVETWRGIAYECLGRRGEAKQVLDDLLEKAKKTYIPSILLANLYFALGEKGEGFNCLNKGYEEGDSTILEIKADPVFDSVCSDPRFTALLKKTGLEK